MKYVKTKTEYNKELYGCVICIFIGTVGLLFMLNSLHNNFFDVSENNKEYSIMISLSDEIIYGLWSISFLCCLVLGIVGCRRSWVFGELAWQGQVANGSKERISGGDLSYSEREKLIRFELTTYHVILIIGFGMIAFFIAAMFAIQISEYQSGQYDWGERAVFYVICSALAAIVIYWRIMKKIRYLKSVQDRNTE
jgi:hypothetical protein